MTRKIDIKVLGDEWTLYERAKSKSNEKWDIADNECFLCTWFAKELTFSELDYKA